MTLTTHSHSHQEIDPMKRRLSFARGANRHFHVRFVDPTHRAAQTIDQVSG